MILIEIPPFLASGLMGELVSAFEGMPVPGKSMVYLFILMSTVTWAVILSKSLLISRMKNADYEFRRRLRRSKTCLEVYEYQENHQPSLLFDIYQSGARVATEELTGTPDPRFIGEKEFCGNGVLNRTQLNVVEKGLEDGESIGADRILGGFNLLRMISFAAPVLGIFSACWILFLALSAEHLSFRLLLSYALIVVVFSLLVAAPAGIARVHFLNQCRQIARKTRRFRDQVLRVFGDAFENPQPMVEDIIEEEVVDPVSTVFHHPEPQIAPIPIVESIPDPAPVMPVKYSHMTLVKDVPTESADLPHKLEPAVEPAVEPALAQSTEVLPIHSPFTLDDDMASHVPLIDRTPKVDFRQALVPDYEEQPPHRPGTKNPDSPYVSANY